jgi:hypothetical protein
MKLPELITESFDFLFTARKLFFQSDSQGLFSKVCFLKDCLLFL